MRDIKELIHDPKISIKDKAETMMISYFSDSVFLREKEYEITKAIIEAFLFASSDIFENKSGAVYLKEDVYKYIKEAHPELEEKYYKNNGGGLHGYIRYIIQKHTKGTVSYLKRNEGDRVHIFTTFGSGKGKYILKDLLNESENEVAIDKTDLSIYNLEEIINDLLRKNSLSKDFFVRFKDINDGHVAGESNNGCIIIYYKDEKFDSSLNKLSKNLKEITDEFILNLASEIAIQICCTRTEGINYDVRNFSRELMYSFDTIRKEFQPLMHYRIKN